ncbi:hypothetical protein DL240_02880 [Lujinxingia litoralis]|uniref:Uncharacterized protein n=1 Tax=Lujinxingia litoralis TaxID=2211119 RepID=A0A328CAL1_9DELT|nr:hypothetical protein [Lujinxingia litoralis]RAL25172.1 hypothetical protein DL240_02880 [Lujinxingia litoralis]
MFGSFAIDEGDAFSDIEFALFIQDERFDTFPQHTWLQQIHPVAAYFIDDFGHHTALFENGVRGEFHFMRASEMSVVESWKGYAWFPSLDAAVVLDRSGELSRYASVLVGGPPERGGGCGGGAARAEPYEPDALRSKRAQPWRVCTRLGLAQQGT